MACYVALDLPVAAGPQLAFLESEELARNRLEGFGCPSPAFGLVGCQKSRKGCDYSATICLRCWRILASQRRTQ
jgi:hypothetical protein